MRTARPPVNCWEVGATGNDRVGPLTPGPAPAGCIDASIPRRMVVSAKALACTSSTSGLQRDPQIMLLLGMDGGWKGENAAPLATVGLHDGAELWDQRAYAPSAIQDLPWSDCSRSRIKCRCASWVAPCAE
ncbi:hypothetical protein Vretimale_8935 [Volvox reticuliferus]|uniref:Uncharacterized protein n=1 Tax=Volvox reticuliferus TaxID=1737510 RepID=A0A8J4GCT8_9CHLO|nr:hypothetical protein Vretimale_8935 [Volvox reticuliferus]